MTLPHERTFTYRPALFWTLSALAMLLASRTPGLTLATTCAGTIASGLAAWAVFRYTRWLVRIDGRFQDVNPYKIRVTTLAAFYGSCVMAAAVLIVGAWLPDDPAKTPLENASVVYVVPALLGSAAGALSGGRESGVIE